MKLCEPLTTIESTAFSVEVNVVSDLRNFLRVAEHHEAGKALADLLPARDWQEKVAERIAHLCEQPIDPQYENPGDTALAVYLWLLDKHNHDLALRCGGKVREAPRCWWAWRVAEKVAQPTAKNGEPIASRGASPQPLQEG